MTNYNFRVLIIDDEPSITRLLSRILKKEGYNVETTTSCKDAMSKVRSFAPNLVISDLKMPEMDGLTLFDRIKADGFSGDFIILTAYGTVENAVEAMKKGVFDYLIKPLRDPDELRVIVSRALEHQRLRSSEKILGQRLSEELPPTNVIFAGMEEVWEQVSNVASTDATVLLQGESGTGKSLIAKVIHALSKRKGPFVEINCAAIPENLIESELFGHEKGAFTGAHKQKKGKFELANLGTIFLDEIGEMPLGAQSKLLRILQERAFERVGGAVTLKTDARIVAATNQDIQERIRDRLFREDLYYRLNVFPITLPPLRRRKEAISIIGAYFIETISKKVGRSPKDMSGQDWEMLKLYSWPGNIRELHNVLERAAILNASPSKLITDTLKTAPNNTAQDPLISGMSLQEADGMDTSSDGSNNVGDNDVRPLKEIEKDAIKKALKKTGGHRKKTAEILGISIRSLHYKLKEYGLN